MQFQDKTISLNFERQFCLENLLVWQIESRNLFYSAEVLHQFETIKKHHFFNENAQFTTMFPNKLTDRCFFNYRVQRMLWAYGFENLLKLIILANHKRDNPAAKEVPFWEIKSHCLHSLAKKANVSLSEPEVFYSGILEKCSVWAGRYPLPLKQEQMYEQGEPLPSSEALHDRSKTMLEKYMAGEIPRIYAESDIIHGGIGYEEYRVYEALKRKLLEISDGLLSDSKIS